MGVRPTEGQEFCGEKAKGEFIKALLVLMAQGWLETELVLTGGNSRKVLVAFVVCVGEYRVSPGQCAAYVGLAVAALPACLVPITLLCNPSGPSSQGRSME